MLLKNFPQFPTTAAGNTNCPTVKRVDDENRRRSGKKLENFDTWQQWMWSQQWKFWVQKQQFGPSLYHKAKYIIYWYRKNTERYKIHSHSKNFGRRLNAKLLKRRSDRSCGIVWKKLQKCKIAICGGRGIGGHGGRTQLSTLPGIPEWLSLVDSQWPHLRTWRGKMLRL